jgi:predicted HTH domain antitoxin
MQGDLISLKEAQERAGVSKNTLKKILKLHGITLYENPRDARQKLVNYSEIEKALRPRPIRSEQQSKRAA